jgi:hypothetical protein
MCAAFSFLLLSQVGAVTHMLTLVIERHLNNAPLALSALAVTAVAGRLSGVVRSRESGCTPSAWRTRCFSRPL